MSGYVPRHRAECTTCFDTGLIDWWPGQHRNSDEDQQSCPDCAAPRASQRIALGNREGDRDAQYNRNHPDQAGFSAEGAARPGLHAGPGVPDRAGPDQAGGLAALDLRVGATGSLGIFGGAQ